MWFVALYIFARLFWRARQTFVKQPGLRVKQRWSLRCCGNGRTPFFSFNFAARLWGWGFVPCSVAQFQCWLLGSNTQLMPGFPFRCQCFYTHQCVLHYSRLASVAAPFLYKRDSIIGLLTPFIIQPPRHVCISWAIAEWHCGLASILH